MKIDKLFNVLVIGGALLAGGSALASGEQGASSAPSDSNQGTLVHCSKDNSLTCEQNKDGQSKPKAGLVCCWGSSCE